MKRPLVIWLAFVVCAATGFGVLAWFSFEMARLEREATASRRLAAVEENIRLALWRMDSALAAVHGREAARPWQDYESFHAADAAFSRDFASLSPRSVLLPSPLLKSTPPFIRMHVQVEADGTMRSPQAPPETRRAAVLASGVPPKRIDAARQALAELQSRFDRSAFVRAINTSNIGTATTGALLTRDDLAVIERELTDEPPVDESAPRSRIAASEEQRKSANEQRQREELYVQQNTLSLAGSRQEIGETGDYRGQSESSPARSIFERFRASPSADEAAAAPEPASDAQVAQAAALTDTAGTQSADIEADAVAFDATAAAPIESGLQALWIEDELFFARQIALPDRNVIQAAWLHWKELQEWLLSRTADLLPNATLEPAINGTLVTSSDSIRRLAFLPARVVPGTVPVSPRMEFSFLRLTLAAAWIGAVLAVGALGLLLFGTLRLSERRGAFVSAVTHELRTPLTTFRMYTEMLGGGMVTEESKRRGYLETLRKEADRLHHLVENVLTYSRIERGRARHDVEETTPARLLTRLEERLRQRAQQGGLTLTISYADDAGDRTLRTDITAIEQVLFNLVDNAAKYAARPSGDGRITLTVARDAKGGLALRLIDDGPGIDASVRKRLFQPFSKSAAEAAHTKPGVGLGLALSRRLARDELGGDLVLESTGSGGTVFCLRLPLG